MCGFTSVVSWTTFQTKHIYTYIVSQTIQSQNFTSVVSESQFNIRFTSVVSQTIPSHSLMPVVFQLQSHTVLLLPLWHLRHSAISLRLWHHNKTLITHLHMWI